LIWSRLKKGSITVLIVIYCGCFTLLKHPAVEVTYEDNNRGASYTEDYHVFVDEDCQTCHRDFSVVGHYNSLIPVHNSAWSITPWWFDDKYQLKFNENTGEAEQIFQPIPIDGYTTPSPSNANRYIIAPKDKDEDTTASIKKVTSSGEEDEQSDRRIITRDKKDSDNSSKTVKRKNKKRR
jgi:hypothetical protein